MELDGERFLVSGFWSEQREALQRAGIPVAASIESTSDVPQDPDLAGSADIIDHIEMTRGRVGPSYDATIPADLIRQIFDAAYIPFQRAHRRLFQTAPQSAYSWLDVDNHLHMMIHWSVNLLRSQRISRAIFHNLPHEGAYVALYEACRALRIPTLVCSQSIFVNRFWVMETPEDYGDYTTMQGCRNTPVDLPEKPETPFYMRQLPKRDTQKGAARRLRKEQAKLALKRMALVPLIKPRAFRKNIERVTEQELWLPTTQRMEDLYGEFERDRDYIYFPLHLQPEMSTDAMGGIYADQLRALEELCAVLPDDMVVYVKENPKQGIYMREPSFFDRLAAIPNAVYLPVNVPTFELIEHSRAVATITGNAGWEALIMGRSAITFGTAWYNSLPGTFRWQDAGTLSQALDFQHDRDALETAFGDLTSRMATGIIDPYFGRMIEDHDRTVSAREIAESLGAVLTAKGIALNPKEA